MSQVMAAERALATATAARARALSALADARPAGDDRPAGTPGAMSAERRSARADVLSQVSEWVVRELRVSLAVTDTAADRMLVQALTLTRRLPGVLAALEGGTIHCGHLPALVDLLDPITDHTLRARIEAELLRWLAARGATGTITTPAQLRAKVHRVLLARDARTQAENLRRALATRGVFTSPEPVPGMSGIYLRMTTAEAAALYAALDQLGAALPGDEPADGTADGPRRSRAEEMLDVVLDLVLRPGSSSVPAVQISLTVVAALETLLGADIPGDIGGHLVPAAEIRALIDLLTGIPLADDHDAEAGDEAGDRAHHEHHDEADARAGDPQTEYLQADDVEQCAAAAAEAAEAGDPRATAARGEPPPLDDATYWAMVDQLVAAAPDADDMWFDPDDPLWPDHDTWPCDDTSAGDTVGTHPVAPDDACPGRVGPARPTDHSASPTTQSSAGTGAETALDALRVAAPADVAALRGLLAATRATTGGGLTHRPRIALTHALTGALVSLTDLAGLQKAAATGTGLGPPPDTDGYHPAAALERHVRTRDRRCRTPGCRRPVMTGELDHHVPHPAGPTSAANLCGLCLTDHRGKHQAPGWRHHLHPDGTYTVTTPAGLTARTAPPAVL
ncbi:DUF222 domain-containing protein [Klenkia sp. LSe6-5]|uniref:DUF222 domain-containing protein n=1 Tax=Klenkia sesuvii TaxID=3103137 RepID=A0ABU8DR09_9ACTN